MCVDCVRKRCYVFSDMKIKRYMMVCATCGKFIKWVPDARWKEIKDNAIIISESERQELRNKS